MRVDLGGEGVWGMDGGELGGKVIEMEAGHMHITLKYSCRSDNI